MDNKLYMHEATKYTKLQQAFLLWLFPELFPFKDDEDHKAYAQMVAKFMINELNALMNQHNETIEDVTQNRPYFQEYLRYMMLARHHGILTAKQVKDILPATWDGEEPFDVIQRMGILEENTNELELAAKKVIDNNPKAVADFKGGKVAALNSLLGQVMKEMKGKADPNQVRETLNKLMNIE